MILYVGYNCQICLFRLTEDDDRKFNIASRNPDFNSKV